MFGETYCIWVIVAVVAVELMCLCMLSVCLAICLTYCRIGGRNRVEYGGRSEECAFGAEVCPSYF